MKIVFFGTPDFAKIVLKSLVEFGHEIVAVVTGEDKRVGRKQVLTETPVKIVAKELNLPVFQFHKIRLEGQDVLKNLNADIFVTCAYGQILSKEIINSAKFGTINVHFSLLPAYRGASPVQSALMMGETKTGVTIMRTDEGIDTGDIICQKSVEIEKEDNTETLLNKLAIMSTTMLEDVLKSFEAGTVKFSKQGPNFSYFPMIKKEDGLIDFNKTSTQINNKIRALYVWPNAYCFLNGKVLKFFKAEVVCLQNFDIDLQENKHACGTIVMANKNGLVVECSNNTYLKILELQIEGSKRMNYKDFLNGNKNLLGTILNGNIA
ncbi:MAG: methionyl-tRNA formyltransferase [Christensenellales bacterium]